ncbi:unnamed protein product [marine sediment metagenome]|uniref:Uncharacterized protein n=1 Tax=marine sediment metagenome TaxID=412755 RepID=X1GY09_9ZZZZ
MSGKIAAPHHSIVDWDFQQDGTGRSLDAAYYISPPTSLKLFQFDALWSEAILCRIPDTLVLPQGEFRTWFRKGIARLIPCLFRNQAPLGTSNGWDCYRIYLTGGFAQLERWDDGAPHYWTFTPCIIPINEWVHFRVFWYNGKTPAEREALCVDIYLEIDGQWVKQGDTLYDTLNKWKDSAINRCGFFGWGYDPYIEWWDDTEIWGPV